MSNLGIWISCKNHQYPYMVRRPLSTGQSETLLYLRLNQTESYLFCSLKYPSGEFSARCVWSTLVHYLDQDHQRMRNFRGNSQGQLSEYKDSLYQVINWYPSAKIPYPSAQRFSSVCFILQAHYYFCTTFSEVNVLRLYKYLTFHRFHFFYCYIWSVPAIVLQPVTPIKEAPGTKFGKVPF